ncbi:MAG TPA: glutamine-hydrolyzing GMP synthase [Armatimonadota bacterium]|nr:glutamine-hydrolyzing GMP synthase [Armatimonadota bacterium]HOM81870.1 glutamine-hydrolyzing GMP synthase [Armatimonadota bacterium]HOQ28248.1 glutamine-hydrolyzing GMP synthase [Armatimonadota bacterium]HPO74780.1 glutamine-hydrolyzing GMP synthase [Armatimonadota bacterium]HPT96435.1 glutamine-hydrolyzing GMP synthase [Armatimonadota bacterium]
MPDAKTPELVIVLDFGAQYSQLIARRIRECRVYCEILPAETTAEEIARLQPRGIVLSGGPNSVYDEGALRCDRRLFELGIPILGICYGHQLMAHLLEGRVVPAETREYGRTELSVLVEDEIFRGLGGDRVCWMSHGDMVQEAPAGFQVLARTDKTPVAAMGDPVRRLYGVQFHPEVTHTPWGSELLRNFVINVCGCSGSWTMKNFIEEATEQIRATVGNGKVFCATSGGVDSMTLAALVHRAVGDQLTCVFVNHGLLRKGEAEQVRRTFAEHLRFPLVYVDAEARFLERLRGVTDPEQKRKIIGHEFIHVLEAEADKVKGVGFLAQGTLYPDVIESGTGSAAKIKTHHNVGGLPERMRLKLVEPFRRLFKDEVRRVGTELGLPPEIVGRHPFPGPGLAVRILGEITPERLEILREADAIAIEELRNAGLYDQIWQAFCTLLPVRSVGVMGDQRTYAYPIVIRAVTSEDAMTASWARIPYDVLERISSRISNEVRGVNRVVYDISSKPPATIEWE